MRFARLVGIVVLLFTSVVALQVTGQDSKCIASRLKQLDDGYVLPGDPNNIRSKPSTSSEKIGIIPGGAVFNVLKSNICAEGYLWAEIVYKGIHGYTVEASGEEYFLSLYIPPTPQPISTPQNDNPLIFASARGVTFSYPVGFAEEVTFQPQIGYTYLESMNPMPNYLFFEFEFGDEHTHEMWLAHLYIYRTEAYAELDSSYNEFFENLQTDIQNQKDLVNTGHVTDFMVGVAQLFHSSERYINFQNGQGYRFVTYYAQDDVGIPLDQLSYVFIGLTDDLNYFVRAEFRGIDAPLVTLPRINRANPGTYYTEVAAIIRTLPEDGFNPTIGAMDSIMSSISIADGS